MTRFRVLSEQPIWQGSLISVAKSRFAASDGQEFERDVVHHPGAVSVVPILNEGTTVVLVRQFRAPVNADLLEIPAGKRDVDGEAPEGVARRELEEEIGMRAGRLEKLAEFYNSPGFCDEHSWVYMGLDLEPCATSAHSVEEQHMTIEHVALEDVPALISSGAIRDAKTIIGLCLAREALH